MSTVRTIPKPAERAEWLKVRHRAFNASDAACLYRCHPHKTLEDVVADKLQAEPTDNGQTEAMERGIRLEPFLLEWWGDRHGVRVITPEVLYVNGPIMATIDGEIIGVDDAWIEAKTTASRWDEVPEHVFWQVAAQAAASGKRECHVVWFDSDLRLKEQRVRPSQHDIDDIAERAKTFMDWISLGLWPEDVELATEHLRKIFPQHEAGEWVYLDDDELELVRQWDALRRARIAAANAEEAKKDEIARKLLNAEGAKYNGLPVVTFRTNKASRRFSSRAHEANAPECHERHTAEIPGARVLRTTKELSTFLGGDDGI